jgi:hypothetical protein
MVSFLHSGFVGFGAQEDSKKEHAGKHSTIEEVHALIQSHKLAKQQSNRAISRKPGNGQHRRNSGRSKSEAYDTDPDTLRKERVQVTRQLQYLESKNQPQTFDVLGLLNWTALADRFIMMVSSHSLSLHVFDVHLLKF